MENKKANSREAQQCEKSRAKGNGTALREQRQKQRNGGGVYRKLEEKGQSMPLSDSTNNKTDANP